jgi:hypothetical protein
MDEQTLPERLRDLAHDADSPLGPVARAALTGAADELERLTWPPAPGAAAIDAYLGELAQRVTAERDEARAEVVRLRAVHSEADRAPGEVETVARRFVAYYRAGWAVPAPGSFVQAGPVGSVWRVLAARGVEPKPFEAVLTDPDGGERPAVLFELEPVDPHDVPMTARVDIVPMPLDVAPEPADAGTVQP